MEFASAFRGARVFVTGHTGFKGSWLAEWLTLLGADVTGFSAYIPSTPSHFEESKLGTRVTHVEGDVRDHVALQLAFAHADPQFVFHLAAQPIVRTSYDDPRTTFETNVLGTVNVLECLRASRTAPTAVLITSDKCYDNQEWPWGYRETDLLGGDDPYSASKAAAEIVVRSYVRSFFPNTAGPRVATARAGNVIGGGDWAASRIVPDCMRAWTKREEVVLRHPHATRPWQHVLEPLSGYLWLAARLAEDPALHGEPFNFGPAESLDRTVEEVVHGLAARWTGARWRVESPSGAKRESTLLRLAIDKARGRLGWRPVLDFHDTLDLTAAWYRAHAEGHTSMHDVTTRQIGDYVARASKQGLPWAQEVSA